MSTTLQRQSFTTSRELDFFSEKELIAQTGHAVYDWPLVIAKELIDNALDACEEGRVPPKVSVTVDDRGVTVTDNGPGIPPEAVARVCDYQTRTSSREAYVAPDRGAQGNALKTLIAMPFVLSDGAEGTLVIEARGVRHELAVAIDPIEQRPILEHNQSECDQSAGTSIFVSWPDDDSAGSLLLDADLRFLQIVEEFAILNPHATITVDWRGDRTDYSATNPEWKKWVPSDPTSVHWYDLERFERLVAAYLSAERYGDRRRTVREFMSEFDGLSGSKKQKQVLDATGLSRAPLSDLVSGGDLDHALVASLLGAMKSAAKPVTPKRLGVIGEAHIRQHFASLQADDDSFKYQRKQGDADGVPWIIEAAFAHLPEADDRRLITGVNWSPAINDPFRELGRGAASLEALLEEQEAGEDEPVVTLVHLVTPRAEFRDRGKSAVVLY